MAIHCHVVEELPRLLLRLRLVRSAVWRQPVAERSAAHLAASAVRTSMRARTLGACADVPAGALLRQTWTTGYANSSGLGARTATTSCAGGRGASLSSGAVAPTARRRPERRTTLLPSEQEPHQERSSSTRDSYQRLASSQPRNSGTSTGAIRSRLRQKPSITAVHTSTRSLFTPCATSKSSIVRSTK